MSSVCFVPSEDAVLVLGDILAVAGLDPADALVIRHTPSETLPRDATPDQVLAYTRDQFVYGSKIGANPPGTWLLFWSDGGLRSRFYGAYDNAGELLELRTDTQRFFDLTPSRALASLRNRLVVEWTSGARNWAAKGTRAVGMPVIEIADALAFPGFDAVLVTNQELRELVTDARYERWRAALASVQGIYLIADRRTGQLYVGQASGESGLLGRWRNYALTGHGGNRDLVALLDGDAIRARELQYSILRVFGLGTSPDEINAAEEHYKRALLSRAFGLNGN